MNFLLIEGCYLRKRIISEKVHKKEAHVRGKLIRKLVKITKFI